MDIVIIECIDNFQDLPTFSYQMAQLIQDTRLKGQQNHHQQHGQQQQQHSTVGDVMSSRKTI